MAIYTNEMLESMKKVEAARAVNVTLDPRRMTAEEKDTLLKTYHPDYKEGEFTNLSVGPNKGEKVPLELAAILQANPRIDPEKIDLSNPEALDALVDEWRDRLPAAEIVPVSAKERFNVEGLFRRILELLPEGPAFYPKDTLTDKSLRFFASEIIREKILKFYDKEIPYSCQIEIDSYKEEPAIDRIAATIYVMRDSQKGILIGHKGEKLKRAGQAAREDMEEFLGKKVFLQLHVKVSDDWRNDERQLKRFGYDPE